MPLAPYPNRNLPTDSAEEPQFLRLCRTLHKRRNWLFADTPRGASASANLYSLIETAKANGIEPYVYLCHIY